MNLAVCGTAADGVGAGTGRCLPAFVEKIMKLDASFSLSVSADFLSSSPYDDGRTRSHNKQHSAAVA